MGPMVLTNEGPVNIRILKNGVTLMSPYGTLVRCDMYLAGDITKIVFHGFSRISFKEDIPTWDVWMEEAQDTLSTILAVLQERRSLGWEPSEGSLLLPWESSPYIYMYPKGEMFIYAPCGLQLSYEK